MQCSAVKIEECNRGKEFLIKLFLFCFCPLLLCGLDKEMFDPISQMSKKEWGFVVIKSFERTQQRFYHSIDTCTVSTVVQKP